MVAEAAPQLCCVFVRCSSASCMLQVRFNLTRWDPGLLHPSIPAPEQKTHLHGRNYSVYSLHNIVILGTFVRCKQNLLGTTCFFNSTWVACGCSRLLMSLHHMVSLIVPNVFLIFRWVCGPEQLSSQIQVGKANVYSIGPPEPVCAMHM